MTAEAEVIALRRAVKSDIDDIAALYHSCIGIAGTTWDEYYPLRRDAERDLAVNGLYVAEVVRTTVCTTVCTTVGCVSVTRSELEALAGWRMRGDGVLELSRLAVRPDCRGHGYAADIISAVIRGLKNEGCPAVYLLAARSNRAAVRTYEKLGFELCGECRMYDIDFYMYEKLL